MRCAACNADNSELARFCGSCGTRLTRVCPHCASPVALGARFCTTCGGSLPPQPRSSAAAQDAGAERRRVSILFADLENFTTLAESLDPEEVRAVQSRYFEVARAAVTTYAGTIEKFIGDAVVAVWGAPVAHEDDAERAVLAALELVTGVPRLGGPAGARLAARAAVATGEAAVTLAAEGQGMVSGDVINVAARLQSLAPSGGVIADAATREALALGGAAIDVRSVGPLQLKGKTTAVEGFVVTAGAAPRGGRGAGHTGAFVGRASELQDLIRLYEAVARERRGRMASVLGIAGIGKSRLAWELERHLERLPERVEWLTGRAPAYGEGVAFAAVAEMVRRCCRISDRAEAEVAHRQLVSTLEELIRDPDERSWIEPRLGTLLEGAASGTFEREELFAAWRRFFERMAERAPTVLVFEDLQWAEAGLLDFIEHLATWSREQPLLVLTLARPELLDVRPTWGAAQRAFTALRLERLPDTAMRELLDGRARGLPRAALRHILERAGGIPLYAVEVVRMLIDRGQLHPAGGGFRLEGPLAGSDIPDSLHGILAARVDALPPAERSLLLAAAVLGRRFHPDALAAVSSLDGDELARRIDGLVARELLAPDDELRSPGRGQLAFVQDLVRELAYRTLSRAERFEMHLAAARHLEALEMEDLREAAAGHLAAAYEAGPSQPHAAEIAGRSRLLLREAARRSLALHAPGRALGHLDRALAMDPDEDEGAELLAEAAAAARMAGRLDVAEHHLRRLIELHGAGVQAADATRLRAELASVLLMEHHNAAAIAELESAVAAATDEGDTEPAMAALIGQLARARLLVDDHEEAARWADRAIALARRHRIAAVSADALATRGTARFRAGEETDGRADLVAAAEEARVGGFLTTELRAQNNLAWLEAGDDPRLTLRIAREGGTLATEMGVADWAVQFADVGCLAAIHTGDWAWALETFARFDEQPIATAYRIDLAASISIIRVLRGDPEPMAALDALEPIDPATDRQDVASIEVARAWQALLDGDLDAAHDLANRAADGALGVERHHARVLAARSRLWSGDASGLEAALAAVEAVPVGGRATDAARRALRAGALGLAGDAAAAEAYAAAADAWRALELPIHLAMCLAEGHRFAATGSLDEADAVLERIGAGGLRAALHALQG